MAQELTSRGERMRSALASAFSPQQLDVIDESHLHHGHAGAQPGGETHFRIKIQADALNGLSRLAKHRAINGALAEEFRTGLHALAIEAE